MKVGPLSSQHHEVYYKIYRMEVITSSWATQNILSLLAKNRHVSNLDDFLSPQFPLFPQLSPSIKKAVKIISSAIKSNQNILIYGDYDVDGITATAILWQALYKHTKNITPFIPHREIDGYGLKSTSFFRFQQEKKTKFDLLITVDNGIVADKEIQKILDKQDIKIIITDHHLPSKKLVTRNCKLITYVHTTSLSGSAISWFLAREFDINADLGLAALGTVADCLPLTGANRSIVIHGLQSLRLNPSPGIRKLIQVSSAKQDSLSAYDLGFLLGPRINAVGRLADPTEALRLLCSTNSLQATRYAQSLNSHNQDRQVLQKESLDLADSNIDPKNKIIIVSNPMFNPGIIGLLSGRLTEKYSLPSIVISEGEDISKGSCRSIPEINIIERLREFSSLFVDLGGHAGAAGFSILTKNIPKLKSKLTKYVNQKLANKELKPHIYLDAEMKLSAVNLKNIEAINKLAPFGVGNIEPQFLFKNLRIVSKKLLGAVGDHLKLRFENNIDGLAFKKGELDKKINIGDSVDIIANLSINEWNNTKSPQLIIKEINTLK